MKRTNAYDDLFSFLGAAALISVPLLIFGGWIANLIKLIDSDFAQMSGMIVFRIIGVLVVPIGGVLGFL